MLFECRESLTIISWINFFPVWHIVQCRTYSYHIQWNNIEKTTTECSIFSLWNKNKKKTNIVFIRKRYFILLLFMPFKLPLFGSLIISLIQESIMYSPSLVCIFTTLPTYLYYCIKYNVILSYTFIFYSLLYIIIIGLR